VPEAPGHEMRRAPIRIEAGEASLASHAHHFSNDGTANLLTSKLGCDAERL